MAKSHEEMHNTSVLLDAHSREIIAAELEAGTHRSAGALIRVALAEYAARNDKRRALDAALRAGEASPRDPRSGREIFASIRRDIFGK
jgi:Arc/MetJ-type ribon-helix-helix transcriptional regulator